MQRSWTNRNIDLNLLTNQMGEFFKEKDFNAVKVETERGYQIFAEDSKYYKLDGYITVTIEGKPEDFSIEIELCKEGKSKGLPRSIMLTTLFGGGYFLSKQLKADEDWIKLKRDFWAHADMSVINLSGSATPDKLEPT